MKNRTDVQPYYQRSPFRIVTALFGLLLVATGVFVALTPVLYGVRWIVGAGSGAALLALGLNAILASYRATEPWVSRIGPLP